MNNPHVSIFYNSEEEKNLKRGLKCQKIMQKIARFNLPKKTTLHYLSKTQLVG